MGSRNKSSFNFEDFNNFRKLSDAESKILDEELKRRYTRKASVVIFRHGHRTPFKYKNLTSNPLNELFEKNFFDNLDSRCFKEVNEHLYAKVKLMAFPPGETSDFLVLKDKDNSGKLTSVGAKQLKCLGKRLRTRYTPEVSQVLLSASDDQRPEHSDSCGLLTFSSRTERTIESLRSLLVGLFEKEIREGVDPLVEVMVFASAETNWLLMPFKQYPELKDATTTANSVNFMSKNIPGFSKWSRDFCARFDLSEQYINLQNVRDYVTSFRTFSLKNWSDIEDSMPFEQQDLEYSSRMLSQVVTAEKLIPENGLAKSASQFFESLLDILSNDGQYPLALLSGHDTTINTIRVALRAQDYSWPHFASNIAFEVYQDTLNEEGLKLVVLFDFVPVVLKSISHDVLISLDDFKMFVNSNLTV
ncbi:lysophosphatidic acid phosphatase type 6-like [Convolutriloba macropyga]|uniref:lysophosphatidic acid phosphatase type 6-like n=1 Tax=Convolutriloba macropyga TaxID=536237 RepID=UPI003F522D87